MKKAVLFISIVFLSINSLFSQNELKLAEAIKKGLENNFDVRITAIDLETAKNNNTIGNAGMLPSITAGLNEINRFDKSPSSTGTGDTEVSTISFAPYASLNWVLFSGFALKTTKENYETLEQLAGENLSMVLENTVQAIILAYHKALLEKERLEIMKQVLDLSRDRYNYLQSKKEIGVAVTYDVLQSKNNFLNDSSTFILQEISYKNSLRNLNLLMGEKPGTNYFLSDDFQASMPDYEFGELTAKMLSDNQILKLQYLNQQILRNTLKLSKSQLYPTVALNSGYDWVNSRIKIEGMGDATTSDSYDYYANISLSYTLFNGGKIRKDIKNANLELESGELSIEQLQNSMSFQLLNTFEFYQARKQLYHVAVENEKTAKLNLDISEEKFKSGAINSFNYRDIQLIYLNAAYSKLESVYNLNESNTELLRLTGSILSKYQ